jgi:hypothetical protein
MLTDKPHPSGEGIRLEWLVDQTHPLVKLTKQIEWGQFTQAFGPLYAEEGRPSVPVRVMSRDPRSGSRNVPDPSASFLAKELGSREETGSGSGAAPSEASIQREQ